jgi:uncharacterized UBP type Zn finger protein
VFDAKAKRAKTATQGRGTGIKNAGNTCYANTAIQCIRAVPVLHTLLSTRFTTAANSSASKLTSALAATLTAIAGMKAGGAADISTLLSAARLHAPVRVAGIQAFAKGSQHDVQEFTIALLDAADLASSGKPSPVDKCVGFDVRQTTTCCDCGFKVHTLDHQRQHILATRQREHFVEDLLGRSFHSGNA